MTFTAKRYALGTLLAVAVATAGCAGTRHEDATASAVNFIVVRHAEKAPAGEDPGLTAAGLARAERLADALAARPVVAAYATDYRRTRQTAAPTARRHGLGIDIYDARRPADGFARELRERHPQGDVLVVGHSNTAPDIAAALCGCPVAAMAESEYGRQMVVRVGTDGSATLDVSGDP
ncbi:SixA phosphatase family protein [Lysobacter sp. A3-1-A15]|uniref:SixA phosphatase family protein n=1 Tax=Novilysobacter viscosus TaxID=3098602 RepID=UPI002ED90C59